jgi:primosomal protein N' (replication factor Y) (superfamily II helicase)
MVPFFEWIADYYLHPLGKVIQSALPGGLNSKPYRIARLTERGLEALQRLPAEAEERKMLLWMRDHPDGRLPQPLERVSSLAKRGLVTLENRMKIGSGRPLVRKFVRAREPLDLEDILATGAGHVRIPNESAFLTALVKEGPISLSELSKRFKNGAYLARKWVNKGILVQYEEGVFRNPAGEVLSPWPPPHSLFEQQDRSLTCIRQALEKGSFSPFLLHGVTGSGKTEVYYGAVEQAIRLGKKTILMVPEIALATYMEGFFRSRLPNRVAVYHSGLSEGERYDQWVRMARGEVDVVVGARSALFSPLPDLGLIIVDEEHDSAYKQESNPRYQARDAAVLRGRMEKAVVVLGSGTPSVQSFQNCIHGKYDLLSMPDRVEKRPLPEVKIVHMKDPGPGRSKTGIVGSELREAIGENLASRHQSILFLNRRGFHRLYLCRTCGKSLRCPNCDVSLTPHFQGNLLICHYCGFQSSLKKGCLCCGQSDLRAYGFGTEKLEQELKSAFPSARIGRMDADSTRRKGEAFQILKGFSRNEIDILVGTQMITKGFDFPRVTLVGVVAADLSLEFPDFRAAERTFQILAQVAGRAGRGNQPGKVIIQTFNPDHYALSAATAHDYAAFFRQELLLRDQLGYPPFSFLASLRLQGVHEQNVRESARSLVSGMRATLARWPDQGTGIRILGPVEAMIYRLKGKYRWQILVKSSSASLLKLLLNSLESVPGGALKHKGVQLVIDVDPYQMV